MPSVSTPMPIAVKKLIENVVLRLSSVGKMPSRLGCKVSSFNRSTNFFTPIACERSRKSSLMKIRELEVVSSSLIRITDRTCQPNASVASRCEKNCAIMRIWFDSRRWIVSY